MRTKGLERVQHDLEQDQDFKPGFLFHYIYILFSLISLGSLLPLATLHDQIKQ